MPSDRAIARGRQEQLIREVLELLTSPDAPNAQDAFHWRFVAEVFGSKKLLDDVLIFTAGKPDLRKDLLCGLLFDVMNRLVE
jgi:hypothetical protein